MKEQIMFIIAYMTGLILIEMTPENFLEEIATTLAGSVILIIIGMYIMDETP